jgi:hypothetical protein
MDRHKIEAVLDEAEATVASGGSVAPSGFWSAVTAVKRDPALVDAYADRMGRIDRAALKNWALLTLPLWLGTVVAVGATLIGLVLVAWAYSLQGNTAAFALLAGLGIVLVSTHGLAHLVTGSLMGMRFTHWFVASVRRPNPGVKVDYATYLRASASSRAWMHASGAIVTKILPFAFIGAALAADVPTWALVVLILTGIVVMVTDVFWSTKASDWKKFRREMRFAEPVSRTPG